MNIENITRVEVIDDKGRAYTRWSVIVQLSLQDDGRTLKVFVSPRPAPAPQNDGLDVLRAAIEADKAALKKSRAQLRNLRAKIRRLEAKG